MPVSHTLKRCGVAALLFGCSAPPLPEPARPLSPTPDAPFRKSEPAPAGGFEAPWSVPPVETAVLANGLSVWVAHQPRLPYVALQVVSRRAGLLGGSEPPELIGFTVRAVIQGGTVWTDRRIIEPPLVNGEGVQARRFTTHAAFGLRVVTANLRQGVQVLGRTVQAPAFDARDVEDARLAELQYLQDLGSAVDDALLEIVLKSALGHDATSAVAGRRAEVIEHAPRSSVERCYRELVRPETSALIAVGDVTLAEILPIAQRELGAWQPEPAGSPSPVSPTPVYGSTSRHVHLMLQSDYGQARVLLLQPAPGSEAIHDELPFLLLAEIALDGLRSRANLGLRHGAGVTYGVDTDIINSHDLGVLAIHASLQTSETASSLARLIQLLRDLQTRPVTPRELQLAKLAFVARVARQLHHNVHLAEHLAQAFAKHRDPTWLAALPSAIAAVTPADLQRVARVYLRPDQLEIGVSGPAELGRDLAELGELSLYRVTRDRPGEPQDDD